MEPHAIMITRCAYGRQRVHRQDDALETEVVSVSQTQLRLLATIVWKTKLVYLVVTSASGIQPAAAMADATVKALVLIVLRLSEVAAAINARAAPLLTIAAYHATAVIPVIHMDDALAWPVNASAPKGFPGLPAMCAARSGLALLVKISVQIDRSCGLAVVVEYVKISQKRAKTACVILATPV